jgi:hypothetical protein
MPYNLGSVRIKFDRLQMAQIESAIENVGTIARALRFWLALSLLFNIVLVALILVVIGGI